MLVRTRFAPSPTGFLHVGSVRTALFAYLYAKRAKGKFILRIEDTDKERSTKDSIQAILDGLSWLSLDYDEGPFYQSSRFDRYLAIANQLVEEGHAYRCVCSKERLEALREEQLALKKKPRYDGHCRGKHLDSQTKGSVIRFKNPQEDFVRFKDEVYGAIEVSNAELDDLILVRSDGHPTYNFAVVVDDWDMKISHVIRGDDHINNTPRQINLFKALKAPIPVFAHLPMILGDDGKRLSKRHGAVSVLQFRDQGILPQALLNYLVRLGWSHGDEEIFSLEEMQAYFDLQHVSRGVSSFNYEKLYWLNQHYLKSSPKKETAALLEEHFRKAGINTSSGPKLEDIVAIQADRCKTLVEMCERSVYFYQDEIAYEPEAVKKHLRAGILEPLTALYQRLQKEEVWNQAQMHQHIQEICKAFDISMAKIGQPLRVAVTGGSMSPSLDITLALIGKTRCLARLEYAIRLCEERSDEAIQ